MVGFAGSTPAGSFNFLKGNIMSESNGLVSMNVDANVVQKIVENKISAEVTKSLGGIDAIVERMVSIALNQKCNSDGRIGDYNSDNKYTFMEAMTGKLVKECAEKALREWLEENREKVIAAIKKELSKPANQKEMVNAYLAAVNGSFQSSWNFQCKVGLVEKRG